jgi:phage baseplate assembly protein V
MINEFLNHIFLGANRAQMNIGYTQLGIITSVDAVDYTVKVLLQPEEIETGFIPYCTPFYGWVAPPSGGEQCLVLFERGNNNVPVAALLLYWNDARAPGMVTPGDTAAGEILLKHSSGSYVKLTDDGKILINGQTEIDVTAPKLVVTTTGDVDITSSGGEITAQATTINLKGNVIIDGTLTANNGAITMNSGVITTNANIITSQDVQASGISLTSHVHSGVTTGGSNTGGPV